jgi:hypothetical protein
MAVLVRQSTSSVTVSPTRTGGVLPRPFTPIVQRRLSAARTWIHQSLGFRIPTARHSLQDAGAFPEPTASIVAVPLVCAFKSKRVLSSASFTKQTPNATATCAHAGNGTELPLPPAPVVPPLPPLPPVPPRAQFPAPLKPPHSPMNPPLPPPLPALPVVAGSVKLLEHAASSATAGSARRKPRSKCRARGFADVVIALVVRM